MRRRLILLGTSLVLIAAILAGLDAAAARLLNSDDLRQRVLALAVREGIDLGFDGVRLHLLPRPRVTFSGIRLAGNTPVTGTVASVSVFPRLRSLLAGRIDAGLLALNGPDLRVDLTRRPATTGSPPAAAPDPRTTAAALLSDIARRLQTEAPGLALRIDGGTVRFLNAGRTALLLASTDARFAAANDRVDLQVRCSSDLWEDLHLDTTLRLPDVTGTGTFDVVNLRGLPLAQAVDPELAASLGLTILSVQGTFSIPDPQSVTIQTGGTAPTVTIRRGDTQVPLRVAQFAAAVDIRPDTVDVHVAGLDVESPQIHLSGTVAVDRRLPQIRIAVDAANADLAALRAAVTALVPDSDAVKPVADIVRAGRLDRLRLTAVGATVADLGRPTNFILRGSVADARLVVPPTDLRLRDVAGDFAIVGGILRADRAGGRTGNTAIRDTHLRIPLIGGMTDFALSGFVDADAADLPDLLYHFVFDDTFRAHLRNIGDVRGSVAARLAVRRTWLGWSTRVDTTSFDVTATDRALGLTAQLRGGRFSYDPGRIAAVGLDGRIGQSQLTRVAARWGLGEVAGVAVVSGPATVELADAARFVHRYRPAWGDVTGIRTAGGPVSLDYLQLHVPVEPSDPWRLATRGATASATFVTAGPLEAVTVATRFSGTRALLGLSDLSIAAADARLTGAGCVMGRDTGAPRFDLLLAGTLGPTATAAFAAAAGLPPEAGSRRQIVAPNLLLVWQPGAFTAVRGPLDIADGPFIDLDMQWSPQRLDVRRLLVKDNRSNAAIALQMAANQLDVQFRGRLAHETVDTLLARNQYVWGTVEGDFAARILTDRADAAQASGTLTAQGVVIPMRHGPAAFIESVTLRSQPTQVLIDSGSVTWGENRLSVNGRVDLSAGSIGLDLAVHAAELDLEPLVEMAAPAPTAAGGPFHGLPRIPVRGIVRVDADRVGFHDLTWEGVAARVKLADSGLEALITSGTYCHIDTPGTLKITESGIAVALMPRAREQPLSATLACLNAGRTAASGSYSLQADLAGHAPAAQLARSVAGPITFDATNGRIANMGWFGRVLRVLQPTSVFKGRLPDLDDDGLDYSEASFTGTVNNGRVEITEAVLKSDLLTLAASGAVDFVKSEIDLAVLASPVGGVNVALGDIPIIGGIFGKSLVSIPVSVSGSLDEPRVIPMDPAAVGAQLFGILERTVQTPVRLIQPLLPNKNRND